SRCLIWVIGIETKRTASSASARIRGERTASTTIRVIRSRFTSSPKSLGLPLSSCARGPTRRSRPAGAPARASCAVGVLISALLRCRSGRACAAAGRSSPPAPRSAAPPAGSRRSSTSPRSSPRPTPLPDQQRRHPARGDPLPVFEARHVPSRLARDRAQRDPFQGALDRRLGVLTMEVGDAELPGDRLQLLLIEPGDAPFAVGAGDVLAVVVTALGLHRPALGGAVAEHRAAVDEARRLAEGLGLLAVGVLAVGEEVHQHAGLGVL